MKLPDERGKNMRGFEVKVIVRAIKVRRHYRNKVGAVLFIVISAEFDRCYLGNSIRLVGRLKGIGQEILFLHGLGCEFRVDAGRTEIEQLLHPGVGLRHGLRWLQS